MNASTSSNRLPGLAGLVISLALGICPPASATLLPFEGTPYRYFPGAYGSRVDGPLVNGIPYGGDEGFTPNIVVDPHADLYHDLEKSREEDTFGDLVALAAVSQSAIISIRFTADPGYRCRLHRVDMAVNSDLTILNPTMDHVSVVADDGAVLFLQQEVAMPYGGHATITFPDEVRASSFTLHFVASRIKYSEEGGGDRGFGIDNLVFSQEQVLDSDGDGASDLWEVQHNFDPDNPSDGAQDRDGDGLSNAEEELYRTNPGEIPPVDGDGDGIPDSVDSDRDGVRDGVEVASGTDPADSGKPRIVWAQSLNTSIGPDDGIAPTDPPTRVLFPHTGVARGGGSTRTFQGVDDGISFWGRSTHRTDWRLSDFPVNTLLSGEADARLDYQCIPSGSPDNYFPPIAMYGGHDSTSTVFVIDRDVTAWFDWQTFNGDANSGYSGNLDATQRYYSIQLRENSGSTFPILASGGGAATANTELKRRPSGGGVEVQLKKGVQYSVRYFVYSSSSSLDRSNGFCGPQDGSLGILPIRKGQQFLQWFLMMGPGINESAPVVGDCELNEAGCPEQGFRGIPGNLWYDPYPADGFEFTAEAGTRFRSINGFPSGFRAPFAVEVDGQVLGTFSPGQRCNFTDMLGTPVESFRVTGISRPVDAEDPTAFPIRISFEEPEGSFRMSPLQLELSPDLTELSHGAEEYIYTFDGDFDAAFSAGTPTLVSNQTESALRVSGSGSGVWQSTGFVPPATGAWSATLSVSLPAELETTLGAGQEVRVGLQVADDLGNSFTSTLGGYRELAEDPVAYSYEVSTTPATDPLPLPAPTEDGIGCIILHYDPATGVLTSRTDAFAIVFGLDVSAAGANWNLSALTLSLYAETSGGPAIAETDPALLDTLAGVRGVPLPLLAIAGYEDSADIKWWGIKGYRYQLYDSEDLNEWSPVGEPVVGSEHFLEFLTPIDRAQRFFRVGVER